MILTRKSDNANVIVFMLFYAVSLPRNYQDTYSEDVYHISRVINWILSLHPRLQKLLSLFEHSLVVRAKWTLRSYDSLGFRRQQCQLSNS